MPSMPPTTRRVAVLASADMMPDSASPRADAFERDEQMQKLRPALAAHGVGVELRPWRELDGFAGEFDAVLPLLCWDYWDDRDVFLAALEWASLHTRVFNPPEMLRWNTDKRYLLELASKGVPGVPTLEVERTTEAAVADAFAHFQTDQLVAKPRIGAGAWRQARLARGEALPPESDLPPGAALLQPFLPSIEEDGEVSLLFFGGAFSHALRKRAKAGDYRIQSLYGGREERLEATPVMRDVAAQALSHISQTPLYARVDLVRGLDGAWALIELELVEPYLYLGLSSGEGGSNQGAQRFAAALAGALAG